MKSDKEIWESKFKNKDITESFKTDSGPALPPKSPEQILLENYVKTQKTLEADVKELKRIVEKLIKYVRLNDKMTNNKIKQVESVNNDRDNKD